MDGRGDLIGDRVIPGPGFPAGSSITINMTTRLLTMVICDQRGERTAKHLDVQKPGALAHNRELILEKLCQHFVVREFIQRRAQSKVGMKFQNDELVFITFGNRANETFTTTSCLSPQFHVISTYGPRGLTRSLGGTPSTQERTQLSGRLLRGVRKVCFPPGEPWKV